MVSSNRFFLFTALSISVIFIAIILIFLFINGSNNNSLSYDNSLLLLIFIPLLLGLAGYYIDKKQRIQVERNKDLLKSKRQIISLAQEYLNIIAEGNLSIEIESGETEGTIFNSIDKLKNNLSQAKQDELNRKKEDDKRNWTTEGLAKFSDILRQDSKDFNEYCYSIISNMVNYLNASLGGMFILNDDNEDNKFLELAACFAYDRQKFIQKEIKIGEGLVGACFLEKKKIFLTELPENYINISSGLGEENPRCMLLVPLKLNEEIHGVLEIASFDIIETHQIDFVERIAESIASSISNAKINTKTAYLLEQSQQQAEEMKAQEEEMRQNAEELQSIQEEMERKNNAMEKNNLEMKYKNNELLAMQEELKTEKIKIEKLLAKHRNDTDDLKTEIEILNLQIKRKDKQIARLTEEKK